MPFGIPGRAQAKPGEIDELTGSHGPVAVANPSIWFETETVVESRWGPCPPPPGALDQS